MSEEWKKDERGMEYQDFLGTRFYRRGYVPEGVMMAVNTDYVPPVERKKKKNLRTVAVRVTDG